MKSIFSKLWVSSKQPRKQRKYGYNAPNHIKHKFMAAPLSKELKKKYGIRAVEIRKGDEVKVMRGKFSKKRGKVLSVEVVRTRVSIDGLQKTKNDGTKVNVWFHPSKVQIVTLDTDDKKRFKKTVVKEESKSTKPETKKNAPEKK